MSYFGISGIRSPYISTYARSRIRTSPTRRQNTAPYTSRTRYLNGVKSTSGNYGYGVSGIIDSLTKLQETKNNAVKLSDNASRLLSTGKNDIFAKKEVTADDGTIKNSYDTDAICLAVRDFAESYNNTISSVNDSYDQSVMTAAGKLSDTVSSLQKELEGIGLLVGRDGKLSVDEKKLKASDPEKVKELVGTSLAKSAASAASRIYINANSAYTNQRNNVGRSFSSYSTLGGLGLYGSMLGGLSSYSGLGGYNLSSLFNRYF